MEVQSNYNAEMLKRMILTANRVLVEKIDYLVGTEIDIEALKRALVGASKEEGVALQKNLNTNLQNKKVIETYIRSIQSILDELEKALVGCKDNQKDTAN